MEELIEIDLTLKEIEFLLSALAKFPYHEVAPLIANISGQVQNRKTTGDAE
jgi:hypothetical protein